MLCEFSVKNFRSFKDKITLDLTKVQDYDFNTECIRDGIISKALIYGYNGVGKSNLGRAIMDITTHLTDKQRERSAPSSLFEPGDFERAYLNADSDGNIAEFSYSFKLQDSILEYQYGKTDEDTVIYETLFIDGQKIVAYNRQERTPLEINLAGTETLNKDLDQIHISVLKYIKSNAVLTSSPESSVFAVFFKFIDNMLFFWQAMRRGYMGYTTGSNTIWNSIIANNHFDDFKLFLKNAGFDSNIAYKKIDSNQYMVYFQFENCKPNFWNNASSGLQSISVFYYWLQMMKYETKPPSFVFIDEFDAFYHGNCQSLSSGN
jgi:AAA15 family ATPase/GTPase